jgi:penicillin G amidase
MGAAVGTTPDGAREQVHDLLRRRVPAPAGEVVAPGAAARITRDAWGVPQIFAPSAPEAYLGLGFAMGQDRLWQMDHLRRTARGTLAEVLGETAVESDRLSRTLALGRIADAGAARLAGDAAEAVEQFCAGVNLARALAERDGLPIEFELLEFSPDPWTPADTLAVLRAFWWYLTGRFAVICVPEVAGRTLAGPLCDLFLAPEGGDPQRSIWPPGLPYPRAPGPADRPGSLPSSRDESAPGSNNWVVAAGRSASGAPVLASDPHVPLTLPGCWYEARLRGGELDVSGVFAAGAPGIFYGRNPDVAWGLTNNLSSLRDLYVEVTDDLDPQRYRRGKGWKGIEVRRETLGVRGKAPVEIEVREVDHGPVVSDVLPPFAREAASGEVISLRWVGSEPTPELEVMLAYAGAASAAEFRGSLRDWACPTFNFIFADRSGEIGYQLTGEIPVRPEHGRGYRSGAEPRHAWAGFVPFEDLPAVSSPPAGWLGSANNAVAPPDWPAPLYGTWPSDYRMQRIAQLLDGAGPLGPRAVAGAQMDELSLRAAEWAPPAVAALRAAGVEHPLLDEVLAWDCVYDVGSRSAVVFEAFFVAWCRTVVNERFPAAMLPFTFPFGGGPAERLLEGDPHGWFPRPEARTDAMRAAWREALAWLETRLGPDPRAWRWGAVHTLTLRHPLGGTPVLQEVLSRGPYPHGGTWNTLNNSLYEPGAPFETTNGVSYRLVVDLAGETRGVNAGGQSGHPGSPHYVDQVPLWQRGDYHPLELTQDVRGDAWLIRPE